MSGWCNGAAAAARLITLQAADAAAAAGVKAIATTRLHRCTVNSFSTRLLSTYTDE